MANMAAAAMKEVRSQLQKQDGHGQIWIDNWNQRFAQLGTLREFLEKRSDVKVIPGFGKKFTVSFNSGGTAAKSKGKGATKPGQLAIAAIPAWQGSKVSKTTVKTSGGKGWDPLVAEAINEIKGQLVEQGGAGKVWVDNWKGRFGDSLGELRSFIESRADKFVVIPTGGKSFMVSLASLMGGSLAKPAQSQKVPAKANATPKAKGSAVQAVKEIQEQLKQQGGNGMVWVDNWKTRFSTLAETPREFIESRPEFELIPGAGNKFTVALAGKSGNAGTKRKLPWEGKPDAQATPAKKAKTGKSTNSLEKEAMAEVTSQLKKQANTEGKVWVKNWNSKFKETLGTLREFLDNHPEKFLVNEGEGTKFTVALL